jgi:hypothetical protein
VVTVASPSNAHRDRTRRSQAPERRRPDVRTFDELIREIARDEQELD